MFNLQVKASAINLVKHSGASCSCTMDGCAVGAICKMHSIAIPIYSCSSTTWLFHFFSCCFKQLTYQSKSYNWIKQNMWLIKWTENFSVGSVPREIAKLFIHMCCACIQINWAPTPAALSTVFHFVYLYLYTHTHIILFIGCEKPNHSYCVPLTINAGIGYSIFDLHLIKTGMNENPK